MLELRRGFSTLVLFIVFVPVDIYLSVRYAVEAGNIVYYGPLLVGRLLAILMDLVYIDMESKLTLALCDVSFMYQCHLKYCYHHACMQDIMHGYISSCNNHTMC